MRIFLIYITQDLQTKNQFLGMQQQRTTLSLSILLPLLYFSTIDHFYHSKGAKALEGEWRFISQIKFQLS